MWFLLILALLAVLAALLLAWPLLRSVAPAGDNSGTASERETRLSVYRDRKHEIDAERDTGRLTAAEAERTQRELVDEVSREFGAGALEGLPAGTAHPRPWLALALSLFVSVVALVVYQQIGAPALALNPTPTSAAGGDAEMEQVFAQIEARTRSNPDDGAAWASLAEGRMGTGEYQRAAAAYEKATRLLPPDARLLADYAEAIALQKGGDLSGLATELLRKALAINAKDPKVLSLLASAEYQAGNLAQARVHLVTLRDGAVPGSPQATSIAQALAQIDSEIKGGPRPVAPVAAAGAQESAPAAPAAPTAAAGGAEALEGTIDISPAMRAKIPPGATLIVFARAPSGSRMPYAAQILGAAQLPAPFAMSDAQAMAADHKLSQAKDVIVEARINVSGNMMRNPGDLFGVSASVKPGTRGVRVVIDQVVP